MWQSRSDALAISTLQRRSCRLVGSGMLLFAFPLVLLYHAGSNYYLCGKVWLRLTASYLWRGAIVEGLCALLACGFSAAVTGSIFELQQHCNYAASYFKSET